MYKIFPILFICFSSAALMAQKTLNQGTLKMEITEVNADDPQVAMQMEMMKGSTIEIHFKENEHVTNMNMMGGLMQMKNQINESEKKMNLFMDMMGQKFWIESNLDEATSAEQKEAVANSKIEYNKEDKKNILGYNCYKMTINNPAMEGVKVSAYITEEIKTKANVIQGFEGLEYQGFPLEFIMSNPMFSMKMEAKNINDKVDPANLKIDSTGYKKMTMKEFQESFGNFGF